MQGAAHGSVVPPRVLAAGMRVEITSDCTVSVGSSIGSCVVQTKRRLGVVSVVDTAAKFFCEVIYKRLRNEQTVLDIFQTVDTLLINY